jgi:signal peptidase I
VKRIQILLQIALICFLLTGCGQYHVVNSIAMKPILNTDQKVKIEKIDGFDRFDVVVIKTPVIEIEYAFRIIGLPGDKVILKDDGIYIDDSIIEIPDSISYSKVGLGSSFHGIESEIGGCPCLSVAVKVVVRKVHADFLMFFSIVRLSGGLRAVDRTGVQSRVLPLIHRRGFLSRHF